MPARKPYRRSIRFQGLLNVLADKAVNKKRELFPGLAPTSPISLVLPPHPLPGSGILTRFPFDRRGRPRKARFQMEFSYLLGSTHPCPIAVHMEPFSTSVFKVLI